LIVTDHQGARSSCVSPLRWPSNKATSTAKQNDNALMDVPIPNLPAGSCDYILVVTSTTNRSE
jgi:hypothetical protein